MAVGIVRGALARYGPVRVVVRKTQRLKKSGIQFASNSTCGRGLLHVLVCFLIHRRQQPAKAYRQFFRE